MHGGKSLRKRMRNLKNSKRQRRSKVKNTDVPEYRIK